MPLIPRPDTLPRNIQPSGWRLSLEIFKPFFVPMLVALLVLLSGPFASVAIAQSDAPDAETHRITLEARLTNEEPPIEEGLEWRIFNTEMDENGILPILATAKGGTKTFNMSVGEYFIHVSYGFAGAVKRVEVKPEENQATFVLNAGGLQLEAITSPDGPIASSLLRFDIFSAKADERGIRPLIARNVRPMQIVPFARGTYHVVSRYGKLNAETRADLRVQAGKLTQATLQHRAARMTFRLVTQKGGSAFADTSWSILAENGDVIKESNSAYPTVVLSEGNYSAIARNAEKIYSHDFKVESGINRDVEVFAERL